MKAQLMKRPGTAKIILFAAILLLVLSIVLAVVSLFPAATGEDQSSVLIDDSFQLSQNEIRRQGLGSFHGGENISLIVQCPTAFPKNFSIVTYNGLRFSNFTTLDIAYSFTVGADYYEAIFFSDSPNAGMVHFEMTVVEPKVLFPFSWLTTSAKILFLASLGLAMLVVLKLVFSKSTKAIINNVALPSLSQTNRRRILALLLLSLVFWFILLAVNTNPLATFENWYTDHARHSYVSSLFFKDGFSIFNEPLGKLASLDNSYYKFVTWPEMPHLYPISSILLFLPFGSLLQNGFDPVMVYKLEIALFLVFAHICLYFFLNRYLKKEMHLSLKLIGVYIIYVPLVIYSANGMFDAVAFLFSLLALTMFMMERYDYFFLLVAVSVIFKYQAGIFLLPLIIVGLLKLFEKNTFRSLLHNKAVIAGAVVAFISGFTAYLSAPFLMATRPEMIMNGINAFSSHSQIPWTLQSFSVLLTLAVTLVFAFYMLNKNSLLSLSALFLLLPSFTLPYFQNWYLPFIFMYVLIPQRKKELEVTMIWLIFMIAVLSFGGVSFNPLQILDNFKSLLKI
jgi:hypothetical protein